VMVIVRTVHGSTMEQLCWIVHRPQCRTVHQTLVYPASSVQGSGMFAKCLVVCGLIDWRGLIFTQERHRGRCGIRDGLQSAKEITRDSREDRVISTAIIHLTGWQRVHARTDSSLQGRTTKCSPACTQCCCNVCKVMFTNTIYNICRIPPCTK